MKFSVNPAGVVPAEEAARHVSSCRRRVVLLELGWKGGGDSPFFVAEVSVLHKRHRPRPCIRDGICHDREGVKGVGQSKDEVLALPLRFCPSRFPSPRSRVVSASRSYSSTFCVSGPPWAR